MIKSLILTSFFMAFAFIAMPVSSAQACATCGCADAKAHSHDHGDKMKKAPCAKCAEAKAHYAKTGEKKPCKKCDEAKAHYDKKAKHSMKDDIVTEEKVLINDGYMNKGSLKLKSGQSMKTGGTGSYN